MTEDSTDYSISVQKLYDHQDFQTILENNLKDLSYWQSVYPNHEIWIRQVIEELKEDTYSRIAFGGFFHNKKTGKHELCCSAIVKKNHFSSYLEIKNFIVFKHNVGNSELLIKKYQHQLIAHIRKYAEQRGYAKLAIELLNRNKKDKELIKRFFENDFVFAGRQTDKYQEADEIVFLTSTINQIYGYDPFDNISASLWILSTFLKSENVKQDNNVLLITNRDKKVKASTFTFYSNRKFDDPVKIKFNTQYRVLIIEEYFHHDHPCDYIKEIKIENHENCRLYIFDFTPDNLIGPVKNRDNYTVFTRRELESLMFNHENTSEQNKVHYEMIGGLLLISNPDRVPTKEVEALRKQGKKPIYIKLGSMGRYITEEMPLVFSYYSKKQRNKLEVWGVGYLQNPAEFVDLKKLRADYAEEVMPKSKKRRLSSLNSDGDRLFYMLKEMQDEELKETPIWTAADFEKHNSYNETDQVICFTLDKLERLPENRRINLKTVLQNPDFINDPQNVFDFYLNKDEIVKLQKRITGIKNKRKASPQVVAKKQTKQVLPNKTKVLLLAAHPQDQEWISDEFDELWGVFQRYPNFVLQNPCWRTDFEKMHHRLTKDQPQVLLLAAHGDEKGICLHNNISDETQLLNNDELDQMFANRNKHLMLVILNSCYSETQAQKISANKYFVLGFKGELSNSKAIKFTQDFFGGFCSPPPNTPFIKRLQNGCLNFAKNHPQEEASIMLWKDGNKIDYTKL